MAAARGSPDPLRSHAAPSTSSLSAANLAAHSRSPSAMSTASTTPRRPATSGADADLLRSLNSLSLSNPTATPSPNRRPSGASPSVASSRAPSRSSTASPNSFGTLPTLAKLRTSPNSYLHTGSPRSPALRSVSSPHMPSPSRSGTPTLLRKASMNSLHSASGLTINTPTHRDYVRRPSSSLLTPSAMRMSGRSASPDPDRKPLPTENSVAREFFQADLKSNHSPDSTRTSETVILLHKDVYGHRWERPNTTKGGLSSVVERPERIQAVTLGISLAYVQNGGRHQEGKHQISTDLDASSLQVPFQIFRTEKTLSLGAPAVANVHGAEWTKELQAMCEDAGAQLDKGGLETKPLKAKRLRDGDEFHEGDLYLNRESLKALEAALGATVEAVDRVCSPDSPTKRAFVAVRPPGHHCSSDWPSGFCWVNNVHVGIMHGFMNHGLTHAAIIDFDLHHGDGSQTLTVDHNVRRHNTKPQSASWKKSAIGYFSIHDINSYPCESGDWDKVRNASICIENAHAQNIWNIHLGEWKDELEFWYLYRTRYLTLLEKVRAFLRREADQARANGQEPKAAIFLSAGFDASEYEMPGMQRHGVNVPTEFYARWTRDVVKMSVEEGLGVDGRVISCLEGGYSDRALYSGTFAHLSGLVGSEVRAKSDGNSIHSRRSTISSSDSEARIRNSGFPYDPTWWAPPQLDTLEATKARPTPAARYAKNSAPPTYSSPTQASNAKVTEFARLRRSTSGTPPSNPTPLHEYERGPAQLPPPPPVYWPTAALELTKLLIPRDRVTVSMTWDELKEQDKQIKKDKNAASLTAADAMAAYPNGVRKSARERKPAQHFVPSEDSKGRSRRSTLVGASDLAMEKAAARGMPVTNGHTRYPSRRLSNVSVAMTEAPSALAVPPFHPSFSSDFDDIRPESSLSVRTAPVRPPAKKGRPAGSRRDSGNQFAVPATKKSTKTTAPKSQTASKAKNQEPAAPGRRSGRTSVESSPAQNSKKEVGQAPIPGKAADPPSTASNMDNNLNKITNGMKKIKINVVTKDMKAARAQAQKEKDATKSTENGETSATPHGKRAMSKPVQPLQQPLSSKLGTSMEDNPQTPEGQRKKDSGIFIAYQPEGPTPEAVPTTGKTTWMPINAMATPSPIKGHGFTSTSTIPFSSTPVKQVAQAPVMTPEATAANTCKAETNQGREIPETPEHRL